MKWRPLILNKKNHSPDPKGRIFLDSSNFSIPLGPGKIKNCDLIKKLLPSKKLFILGG